MYENRRRGRWVRVVQSVRESRSEREEKKKSCFCGFSTFFFKGGKSSFGIGPISQRNANQMFQEWEVVTSPTCRVECKWIFFNYGRILIRFKPFDSSWRALQLCFWNQPDRTWRSASKTVERPVICINMRKLHKRRFIFVIKLNQRPVSILGTSFKVSFQGTRYDDWIKIMSRRAFVPFQVVYLVSAAVILVLMHSRPAN